MEKSNMFLLICIWLGSLAQSDSFRVYYNWHGHYMISSNGTNGCVNTLSKELDFEKDYYYHYNQRGIFGECVEIYNKEDCVGPPIDPPWLDDEDREWVFDPSSLSDSISYQTCAWKRNQNFSESTKTVLYSHWSSGSNQTVHEYDGLKTCQNLPQDAAGRVDYVYLSSNAICLHLYKDQNCLGKPHKLTKEKGTLKYWDMDYKYVSNYRSINRCEHVQLNATIVNFRFITDLKTILIGGTVGREEFANKTIYINNSTSPVIGTHEGRKNVKETLTFHSIPSFQEMKTVKVEVSDSDFEAEDQKDLGVFGLPAGLKSAYESFQGGSPQEGRQQAVEHLKTFFVQDTFVVPPCTKYEAHSFVLTKQFTMEFELEVRISGSFTDGKEASAELVREELPHAMEYLGKVDNEMVLAKTRGVIIGKIGVSTEIETKRTTIPDCEQIHFDQNYLAVFQKYRNSFVSVFNISMPGNIGIKASGGDDARARSDDVGGKI